MLANQASRRAVEGSDRGITAGVGAEADVEATLCKYQMHIMQSSCAHHVYISKHVLVMLRCCPCFELHHGMPDGSGNAV